LGNLTFQNQTWSSHTLSPLLLLQGDNADTVVEVMKTRVKNQALADSIKSVEARKDSEGKDNFDMSDWCK
jgi:BMFP domain-containing protein YqiC